MAQHDPQPPWDWGVPGGPLRRKDVDRLFALAYQELHRMASAVRRGDPAASLSPTALVHEAWLKLAAGEGFGANSELHFKRIAARAMRQLLVEAARRRRAEKRGGGEAVFVTFDEALDAPVVREDEVIALHDALDELERMNPRQAQMVELRFFGGLAVADAAGLLGISEETVHRDWRAARAWLARQVRRGRTAES
ncbi:MAG: ECF-type sigma factor [Bryobacteraceae bacterium]